MNRPRYRIHFRESGTFAIAVNREAHRTGTIHSLNATEDLRHYISLVLSQSTWVPEEILTNVLPSYLPK